MDVSQNGDTQRPWGFPTKNDLLGCFGSTTILGNIQTSRFCVSKFFQTFIRRAADDQNIVSINIDMLPTSGLPKILR